MITLEKNGINYVDVTEEWIKNAIPSDKVHEQHYFSFNNTKYEVDNKNVVLDYSKREKEIVLWIVNTFGGEIYLLPKVNNPEGIKTADYLWNNEYWDLKEILSNGKRALDNRINGTRKQT